MHLKCASGAGRGFGGRREGAGRKPKDAVTSDRCVQKAGQQSMQADALRVLGIAASKVAITFLRIPQTCRAIVTNAKFMWGKSCMASLMVSAL
jgi:hypothetical protein